MNIYTVNREFENGTPARVHRPSGTILLAPSFFRKSQIEQDFILYHEIGHYILQTKDEQLADKYACDNLLKKYGMKATFRALNNTLFDTQQSNDRRIALYNYLVLMDNNINGNNMQMLMSEQVYDNFSDSMIDVDFHGFCDENGFHFTNDYVCSNDNAEIQDLEANDYVAWCRFYGKDFSDASSKSEERKAKREAKKAQKEANKQAKIDAKLAKKEAKTQVILSRANKNNAKATGIANGTYQSVGETIKDGLKSVGNTVKSIFGGGDTDVDVEGTVNVEGSTGEQQSRLPVILGIAGAVIVAIVIVVIVLKKRKK